MGQVNLRRPQITGAWPPHPSPSDSRRRVASPADAESEVSVNAQSAIVALRTRRQHQADPRDPDCNLSLPATQLRAAAAGNPPQRRQATRAAMPYRYSLWRAAIPNLSPLREKISAKCDASTVVIKVTYNTMSLGVSCWTLPTTDGRAVVISRYTEPEPVRFSGSRSTCPSNRRPGSQRTAFRNTMTVHSVVPTLRHHALGNPTV
jgi:hypothetical protein